eukprot:1161570-Pelagomonas_calceolata.AAC.1
MQQDAACKSLTSFPFRMSSLLVQELSVPYLCAQDDNAAQKEVDKFIKNNKGAIEDAIKDAAPNSISIQSDDISFSAAATVRMGLGAIAGVVLSMLMLV